MRWLITIISLTMAGLSFGKQDTLDAVRRLELPELKGPVPVFYETDSRAYAESLADLLGESVSFFEAAFGLREDVTLAILGPGSWAELTPIPYGLPFVSGPPYVVCFPADSDHELYQLIFEGISGAEFGSRYGMATGELVDLFISLIGFHELGHVYARKLGLEYPNNWVFEFMATYFAYYYLDRNFPEYRWIWEEMSAYLAGRLEPAHRTLEDFERLYVRVGVENYAWYQMVLLLRVAEVYRLRGESMIWLLKEHDWQPESTDFHLGEMNDLVPGFAQWARRYGLLANPKDRLAN